MAYQRRTNGAQLPFPTEIADIIHQESSRRALRFDYLQKHDTIFDAYHALSKQLGVDDSWVQTYADIPLEELYKRVVKAHAAFLEYILAHPDDVRIGQLYKSLTLPDDVGKSDVLFVFGAPSTARIERAVELFNQGIANTIIISGRGPHYRTNDVSEARRMANYAIQQGVPSKAIILEEQAISIPDNVKRTLDILEQRNLSPSTVTVIASDFVLQRACMDWYRFTPWRVTICPVAAHPQAVRFTPTGWVYDEYAIRTILNEYAKLIFESKIDHMLLS